MRSKADRKLAKVLSRVERTAKLHHSLAEMVKAHLRVIVKSREVSLVKLDPALQRSRHVLVTTVYNEAVRIPFILKYYRSMGFEHFIVIDNQSDDNLQELLAGESGVSIFAAKGSFRLSRFGYDWVNGILSRYCSKKWVLYVDADEFFIFPHCDKRRISDLTDFMEKNDQDSLQCLMLDMYSNKKIKDNKCGIGEDPLSVCRLYDRDGYVKQFDPRSETVWIKGGVRGRLYFSDNIWDGPALNKTPLVFWKKHYVFLKATHQLWPFRLNGGGVNQRTLRGILLHFKFLADWTTKVANESVRQQHTDEYNAYSKSDILMDDGPDFVGPPTAEYQCWRSLEQDGLLDGRAWPI